MTRITPLCFWLFLLTAPAVAQDLSPDVAPLPDIHLLPGQSAPDVLHLNDFVADYDHADFESGFYDLSWDLFEIDPAADATIDASAFLDLAAVAGPSDGGLYLFTARDASGNETGGTASFRASSFRITNPRTLPDPRIEPQPSDVRFVYPLDPLVGGTGVWEATGMFEVSGGNPTWGDIFISRVYDATGQFDPAFTTLAEGNPVGIMNKVAAAAPMGGNFILSAGDDLNGPYLVAFRAENGPADWDGAAVMVSGTILSASLPRSGADPDFARDERFEGILGELTRVGFNRYNPNPVGSNRLPGQALCSWEHSVGAAANAGVQYGSATVVLPSELPASLQTPDASFPGDHSGNVLRLTVSPQEPMVYAFRTSALPVGVTTTSDIGVVQPGIPYAVDASIATNAPDLNHAPIVRLALSTESFVGISVSGHAGGAIPLEGDGWFKMQNVLEPTADALYQDPPGLRINLIVQANPAATGPVEIYVDNVCLYRTAYDMDLANGATRIPIYGDPATRFPGTVRGDFEAASGEIRGPGITTGANTNGWFLAGLGQTASAPVGSYFALTPSDAATERKAGDANWLEATFNSSLTNTPRIFQIRTPLLSAPGGGPLSDGIYELRADYITPAGATEVPDIDLALSNQDFLSWTRYELRPAPDTAQGTQGAVRKVRVQAALRDVTGLIAMVIPIQHTVPTGLSTAYVDNIEIHQVNDRPEYWDRSLFEAAP